jgi:hypothetical protein
LIFYISVSPRQTEIFRTPHAAELNFASFAMSDEATEENQGFSFGGGSGYASRAPMKLVVALAPTSRIPGFSGGGVVCGDGEGWRFR